MSATSIVGSGDTGSARPGRQAKTRAKLPEASHLLGRKSVLLGMLTSGFVVANAAQPSAIAGTIKPIVATTTAYVTKWAPVTAYAAGQQVLNPNNDVVSAKVANVSSSAYTTDLAKWALSTTYVGQGQMFLDLAKQSGVDDTGTTECAAAIRAAFTAAAASGTRIFARGTYKIATTVTLTSNADLSDAKFNYTGTGVAVRVGGASGVYVTAKNFNLPRVFNTSKSGTGWTAGTIGVECVNLDGCTVYVPHVQNFATGLRVTGLGAGNAYCTYNLGCLENNKVNLLIDADATGWSNQNTYIGGKHSHWSNEGANIAGARHIAIAVCTNLVNNNTFLNPSYEGDTPEFQATIAGAYNIWLNPRWEAATPTVRWESGAVGNTIMWGSYAFNVVQTWATGSGNSNSIWTKNQLRLASDEFSPLVLENFGGNAVAAYTIMEAGAAKDGASVTTGYAVAGSAQRTNFKRGSDAHPRIFIDHVNGRIYLGSGSAAPTAYLDATGFHP